MSAHSERVVAATPGALEPVVPSLVVKLVGVRARRRDEPSRLVTAAAIHVFTRSAVT